MQQEERVDQNENLQFSGWRGLENSEG